MNFGDMIEIKDISGKTRLLIPINKGAKGKFTLMKEDYIILPFSVAKPVQFKLGDYVDLSGVLDESLGGKLAKIYEITDLQKPTYNTSTGGYDYNLQMNAYYWNGRTKSLNTLRNMQEMKHHGRLLLPLMYNLVCFFVISRL